MNYQEMVDTLAGMDDQNRRATIKAHWEIIFSDSFIAYVQGQMEDSRKLAEGNSGIEKTLEEISPQLLNIFKTSTTQNFNKLLQLWHCMTVVYRELQTRSVSQGNPQGMAGHGSHSVMPRGISVSRAIHCYRCGSQVAGEGLCSGCLSTQQSWEQDDIDYNNRLYDQQQQQVDYHRIQDSQIYHQQQQDFNTYTNYYNDY